tara:strand:- start:11 stop:667 length:657 start_codon:yes stop_codon:yes gene_type:complete
MAAPSTDGAARSAMSAQGKSAVAARKPLKQRKATLKKVIEPEISYGMASSKESPAPAVPLPPRRPNRLRPAVSGWQKKIPTPDILSYWMGIRNGKRYPDWRSLDARMIGRYWPNCTLVHCDHMGGRLQIENGFVTAVRQAAYGGTPERHINPDVEFSPMVVDWVLRLAREVAITGKPTHGTEFFPASLDEVTLRLIALPLSEDQVNIDHVLCYVQKLD